MTAVTDQDHTEHTDHMGRMEHGDDRGPVQRNGHPGHGQPGNGHPSPGTVPAAGTGAGPGVGSQAGPGSDAGSGEAGDGPTGSGASAGEDAGTDGRGGTVGQLLLDAGKEGTDEGPSRNDHGDAEAARPPSGGRAGSAEDRSPDGRAGDRPGSVPRASADASAAAVREWERGQHTRVEDENGNARGTGGNAASVGPARGHSPETGIRPRLLPAPMSRSAEETPRPRPTGEVPKASAGAGSLSFRPLRELSTPRPADTAPKSRPADTAPASRSAEDVPKSPAAEEEPAAEAAPAVKPPVDEAPALEPAGETPALTPPDEALKPGAGPQAPESPLAGEAPDSRSAEAAPKLRSGEEPPTSAITDTDQGAKSRPTGETPKSGLADEEAKPRSADEAPDSPAAGEKESNSRIVGKDASKTPLTERAPKSRPAQDSPKPRRSEDAPKSRSTETSKSRSVEEAPTGRPAAKEAAKKRSADDASDNSAATATTVDADADAESEEAWDDGLIARRVTEANAAALAAERASALETPSRAPGSQVPTPLAYDGPLRSRLDALRELVGLSRTRLDSRTLAEAGRVLDEAAARRKLSGRHTVVAIAGATGSGKSQLFNALAGVAISETGVRRPTTAAPIACSWSDGAAALIDRLGIPGRLRRRPLQSPEAEAQLRGLVLVDLPDHDSAAVQHREQVDRILKLVDAVIWVVDPEKYADAVLHERYLRPMAGHAEVMFVVLNQVDRLPGEAADQVLDDLRRLLDEDGVALGEYGEPGATVLALSALTGDGVGDLREALGEFVAERGAAARRVAADVDLAAAELRPVYATGQRAGLSEEAREEFAARLADAVGATAAGEAAERAWLRNANRACGTPWLRLWRWYQGRGEPNTGRIQVRNQGDEEATARQRVEQAVRTVSDRASAGLPVPWAQAVREAAVRGSQGLSEALDELAAKAALPGRPPRPGWWPLAVLVQASMTLLQVVGGLWLVGQIVGVMAPNLGVPVLLMVCGIVGGPLVEWACRMAARAPARRYGQDAERRLREASASCGRARVLDPVAAELLRYREVREQYGRVVGAGTGAGAGAGVGVG